MKLVKEVLDSLPTEFRSQIHNLAVLVEDYPRLVRGSGGSNDKTGFGKKRTLVMGVFQGVPTTQKSVFDFRTGPNRIILYQKNIEAVCRNQAGIRREVRRTVLHELGHYFGLGENELQNV